MPHHVLRPLLLDFCDAISNDVFQRSRYIRVAVQGAALCLLSFHLPVVAASNSQPFEPLQTLTSQIESDVGNETGWFYLNNWDQRGRIIRAGTTDECLANLSYALSSVGYLNVAEYSGASSALSLLPTAGALIGAPTREMWVVFKLMPVAGILSMFLSLGGTITPTSISDYNPSSPFSYGGIIATKESDRKDDSQLLAEAQDTVNLSKAQKFARIVHYRAIQDDSGGGRYPQVWFGIVMQISLIVVILIAMWYAQLGGVITWWCRVSAYTPCDASDLSLLTNRQTWGYMYFWYGLVVATSIFDNTVAAPFTKNWKMRISKAPNNINISETVARVTSKGSKTAWIALRRASTRRIESRSMIVSLLPRQGLASTS